MAGTKQDKKQIDLNQFNQVFFDECAEHLAEVEQTLISLANHVPSDDQLNAVFRAAHSIKGGAGIFGMEDMTVVTHVFESLLDKLRNHEIPYSPSMVDLFLEAVDVIAMQLAGHRDGSEVNEAAVNTIRLKLQQVINGAGSENADSSAQSTSEQAEDNATPGTLPPETAASGMHHYVLRFTPDLDIFKRGVRLENLFEDLEELGEISVTAELAEIDDFSGFDPLDCRTSWLIHLHSDADQTEINDIFEFVADEGQLHIEKDEQQADISAHAEPEILAEIQAANAQQQHAPITGPGAPSPSPSVSPSGQTAAPPASQSQSQTQDQNSGRADMGRRAYDKNESTPGAFGRRSGEYESSIRVGVGKVDQLINQVGELVITQLMLAQTASSLDPILYEQFHRSLLQLEHNTRNLQQSVMSIRLVPISLVFSRFPRMVRELSSKLGKQVELKTIGETTELDKGLVEKITDPLTHLVRNCLDHALEKPEVRTAKGKNPVGTITLCASQVGGRIVIDVIDDGIGLDREKILRKATEKGIPVSDSMSDEEVWHLIFAPGFSTAETITDISGRGVGMDVVLSNVQAMNGRVTIASEPQKGSRVTISLPLTLAILDGLSVAVGREKFIIPLNSIIESLQPEPESLKTINGNSVVLVRGDYIPILPLYELFHLEAEIYNPEDGILILIDVDGEKAAVLVDALLDEHQVVIKSIETNYRKVDGAAGATILGDGRVAFILDVGSLLQMRKRERTVSITQQLTQQSEDM